MSYVSNLPIYSFLSLNGGFQLNSDGSPVGIPQGTVNHGNHGGIVGTNKDDRITVTSTAFVFGLEGNDEFIVVSNDTEFKAYLFGGKGDDIYGLNTYGISSFVIEDKDQGNDTIVVKQSYVLPLTPEEDTRGFDYNLQDSYVENLYYAGNGAVDYKPDGSYGTPYAKNFSGYFSFLDPKIVILMGNSLDNKIFTSTNSGAVAILGEVGNDILLGSSKNDALIGGLGNDSLDGGSGNDCLMGGGGDNTLRGGEGNDTLFDSLNSELDSWSILDSSGGGNNILYGDAGDDIFILGGIGNDTFVGGDGRDIVKFTGEKSDYKIIKDGHDYIISSVSSGTDRLVEIEYIFFGKGAWPLNNTINGIGNNSPSGSVNITGVAMQTSTLTANNTLADADGLGVVSYRWLNDGVVIKNATKSTYTLTQTDVGKNITVRAAYVDGLGIPETVVSAKTATVIANKLPVGSVSISFVMPNNLLVSNNLNDADGMGKINYQWLSNGIVISNSIQDSYKLTDADIGKRITVKAGYIDGLGALGNVLSNEVTINNSENGKLIVIPKNDNQHEVQNRYALAVIKSDGSVISWGDSSYGGDSSSVAKQLDGSIDVIQIYSNNNAFAALRTDGSVVTWGNLGSVGNFSSVAKQLDGSIDVIQIYSNSNAFAALRADGSIITWGDIKYGGDNSKVAQLLNGDVDVLNIYSTGSAFAALRNDGSVVTWGDPYTGGDAGVYDSNNSSKLYSVNNKLNSEVVQIYSNSEAFVALKSDGSVVSWGSDGGDSSKVTKMLNGDIDVLNIYSNSYAFAALRTDGSVVTWGNVGYGADSSNVAKQINGDIDVLSICSNKKAFAALRADGSVITWGDIKGDIKYGGDNSEVAQLLNGDVDVLNIYSTGSAFAALRNDGSVVTWDPHSGDGGDSSSVAKQINGDVDVSHIYSNGGSFAALRVDGSVVTWGDPYSGADSDAVANDLNGDIDVVNILSTSTDFSALRADGSVVTWGANSSYGGQSSVIGSQLDGKNNNDVVSILSTGTDFIALRADGSIVTWGSIWGTNRTASSDKLQSGVVSFANPETDDFYLAAISNHLPSGSVIISGIAEQNKTLNVSNTLADADGLGSINYQWFSDGNVIQNASKSMYSLTQSDVGKNISVKASYIDALGTSESSISGTLLIKEATSTLSNNHQPTGALTIKGLATLGTTLSVTNTVKDADGLGAFSYTWQNENGELSPSPSYTLQKSDVDTQLWVMASYTDKKGNVEKVDSKPVNVTISTKPSVVNDILTGTDKADKLSSLAGDDTLIGGAGSDKLTGGKGSDNFSFSYSDFYTENAKGDSVFNKSADKITDFNLKEHDALEFGDLGELSFYAKLADAKLDNAHLFYVKSSGSIYLNTSTTDGFTPTVIITLTGKPALNADGTDWNYPA